MKKLLLLVAIATTSSSLFAQIGNSYLLANFGTNNQYQFGPRGLGISSKQFGLQWIKATKNNMAYRFGIKSYSMYDYKNAGGHFVGDTLITTSYSYQIRMPKLTFGTEFRKQIHKDVMIYTGADFELGIGRTNKYTSINKDVYDSLHTSYSSSYGYGYGKTNTAISATIRPFIGLRTDWNRFVIGYEASMPINYTHVFNENINRVNGLRLQHQLSLGYKLNRNKK